MNQIIDPNSTTASSIHPSETDDPDQPSTKATQIKNIGWRVTFAAMGINLTLGILYTWSVISKRVPAEWNWSESDKSWPYAIACLVFSLVMVPAGRLQDRIGPRFVATLGGILVGIGLFIAGLSTSPWGYIFGFGIFMGAGIGFGYASATPPAVKWFPAAKTGLIAGIVVSGFGLASVYAAPLAKWLALNYGLQNTVQILGVSFLIVVVGLAQLLKSPPAGYCPATTEAVGTPQTSTVNYTPGEMLRTPQFYLIWFMYACGAGAGLMVIAKLAMIAKEQAGLELGFVLVAVLALGNGAGRVVAGVFSDRFGRTKTLFSCFVMQGLLILILSQAVPGSFLAKTVPLSLISALIGANYGANLTLFPSLTKDFYGLKNFGINYGLVFTSWGVGGFMLALLAGKLYDIYQSFSLAYYGATMLLLVAAVMTFLVKTPNRKEVARPVPPVHSLHHHHA